MFSLFTRNYVGAFIGMFFFGAMFISNIDMIVQSKSILTESGVPNFIGWFTPLALFLYFGIFFLLYNRFLYGCKHVKKSLKLLLILVSILYGLGSILLLIFIIAGYHQGIIYMLIMISLSLKNFYFYTKVKHKQYFKKIKHKDFFKYISIYGIILIGFLLFYTRPLSEVNYPKDYFNINIQNVSKLVNESEVIGDLTLSDYLQNISNKKDKNADYGVIIYNFPEETVKEMNTIYETSKDIPQLFANINYSYTQLIRIQKNNLLKFEYEVLHKNFDTAIDTISHVLRMNKQILNTKQNLSDFTLYIDLQKDTIARLEKYIPLFSLELREVVNNEIGDMDMKQIWKEALESDFNHRLASLSYLYNIPLFIDKSEMLYVSLYSEYLKSENLISSIDEIQFKSIFRKNYFGLYLLEKNVPDFDSVYTKFTELNIQFSSLKNTLN